MDYQKHYNKLCERAKTRNIDEYTEKHHILPRCLGGDDSPDNIVRLTPEEHYLAHQLLVKMYPDYNGLVWAALLMTGHSSSNNRSGNKTYGWLRRRHSEVGKKRIGEKNGSYGTHWYHNPITLERIKCKPDEVPEGYVKGRSPGKSARPIPKCILCDKKVSTIYSRYCDKHKGKSREKTEEAQRLWNQFLESEFESVTKFAKSIGTSQPRLTQLWNTHIEEYRDKKEHGVPFKQM